jgi:hypothetical protein
MHTSCHAHAVEARLGRLAWLDGPSEGCIPSSLFARQQICQWARESQRILPSGNGPRLVPHPYLPYVPSIILAYRVDTLGWTKMRRCNLPARETVEEAVPDFPESDRSAISSDILTRRRDQQSANNILRLLTHVDPD